MCQKIWTVVSACLLDCHYSSRGEFHLYGDRACESFQVQHQGLCLLWLKRMKS